MKQAVTDCKCFAGLMTEITVGKKVGRFLDSGQLVNLETQEYRRAAVLRLLKEGRDGMLRADTLWTEVYFCPACGAQVRYEEAD